MRICGIGSVATAAVEAAVILPYESTVIVAGLYVPEVTAVVARLTVGAVDVPPIDMFVVLAEVTEVTGAVPLDAAVRRPYESTVMLALVYEPEVTAVVTRSICGVEPPVELIRPDVPVTLVTADADEIAVHALPVHTYIVVVVVFQ